MNERELPPTRSGPSFSVDSADDIVLAVRYKWEKKFISALHNDDQREMYSLYLVLDALTEAYWCVRHRELP